MRDPPISNDIASIVQLIVVVCSGRIVASDINIARASCPKSGKHFLGGLTIRQTIRLEIAVDDQICQRWRCAVEERLRYRKRVAGKVDRAGQLRETGVRPAVCRDIGGERDGGIRRGDAGNLFVRLIETRPVAGILEQTVAGLARPNGSVRRPRRKYRTCRNRQENRDKEIT